MNLFLVRFEMPRLFGNTMLRTLFYPEPNAVHKLAIGS